MTTAPQPRFLLLSLTITSSSLDSLARLQKERGSILCSAVAVGLQPTCGKHLNFGLIPHPRRLETPPRRVVRQAVHLHLRPAHSSTDLQD